MPSQAVMPDRAITAANARPSFSFTVMRIVVTLQRQVLVVRRHFVGSFLYRPDTSALHPLELGVVVVGAAAGEVEGKAACLGLVSARFVPAPP